MQFRSHDMLLKRIQLIQLGTLGFFYLPHLRPL